MVGGLVVELRRENLRDVKHHGEAVRNSHEMKRPRNERAPGFMQKKT